MLPLRLRGTRGIRTRYVCSSCCAHVSRGTSAHGRGGSVTRTYATKKKAAAAPHPGESPEDVKSSDATDDSKPKQPPKTSKPKASKAQNVKAKESETPGQRRRKRAPSPSKATKEETAPASDHSNKPNETVKLWQETLDVLKNIQQTQDAAEGTLAGQARSNGQSGQERAAGAKRSLKSHFPAIQGSPSSKAIERQAKLLEGTLDVLKSVLTAGADQRSKASKTTKTTKTPSPTTESERKTAGNKGAKGDDQKSSVKRSRTAEAAVAQGFAALLHETQAKRAAAREKDSKAKSVEKTSDVQDKGSEMGWGPKKASRSIRKVKTKNVGLEPVQVDTAPVPRVEYGLDRVLFNEGVYVLQDPRTRVFNFDPYLATIMPVDEFDFEALKQYVTSSKDTTLIGVAKKHNKKFTGSTSSMTSTLAHFHYLLSSWRPINPERISKGYVPDSENFGKILRAPAATFLHYKDGTYAIDADKEYDTDTILSMLGKSMEKLLTAPKAEYEKYRRSNSHQLTEEERNADESYHYTTFGDFMMRSQLDAYDPRLPGTGVFDLKTRAVVSIRMDAQNHHKGVGYEIRQRQGQWESFEREYYDMIRLAFLKYSLQVRMGRMDGIFVAYHNTQRIFGFQYIPLEEMDLSLHGTTNLTTGNREFMASLELWEEMLKKATERFPNQSLRIHLETRPSTVVPFMYFFAEPVNDDEIKAIQEQNKKEGEKFQERVLGIKPKPDAAAEAAGAELDQAEQASAGEVDAAEDDAASKEEAVEEAKEAEEDAQEIDEEDSEDVWEDMMEVVEQTMESDAQGISAIRDAIEDALEQSGLLHTKSTEEAEQYVEALLKAIVDVDAERASTDEEAVAGADGSENKALGEQKQAQDVRTTEKTDPAVQGDSSPPAPKPSRFAFLTNWFGSSTKEPDAAANQDASSKSESEQNTSTTPEQESASKDDAAEPAAAESKAVDEKPDDNLKDLLVKLTTRIGSSSDAQKATEELSEDQAKLRNFESILLEMMPKAQEAPEEAGAEEDAAATSDKDKEPLKDTSAASSGGEEPAAKPVLGMILTVRNMVNDKYVQRPEKLVAGDKWHVEYTMEEIADKDKAQIIYEQLKKRRHNGHYRPPGHDPFRTAFDGKLGHYSRAGSEFRKKEEKLARKLPVHVVGKERRAWRLSSLSSGIDPGPGGVATSGRVPDKLQVTKFEPTKAEATEQRGPSENEFWWGKRAVGKTQFNLPKSRTTPQKVYPSMKRLSLAEEETAATKESSVEEGAVVEVVEKGSASFREWREKSQQRQDKGQEQELEQEKEKEQVKEKEEEKAKDP